MRAALKVVIGFDGEERHVGGIPWHRAPRVNRFAWLFHRHRPWSSYPAQQIERCMCGALRFSSGPGSGIWGSRGKPRLHWL